MDTKLLHEHPWLLDHFHGAARKPAVERAAEDEEEPAHVRKCLDEASVAESDGTGSDLSWDEEAVVEELLKKRAEMHVAPTRATRHFAWKVMGGKWTREHLGVAVDAFRAHAVTAVARTFATRCLARTQTLTMRRVAAAVVALPRERVGRLDAVRPIRSSPCRRR